MIKKLSIVTLMALGLSAGSALAEGGEGHVEDFAFSFEGPFGTYDQHQLQRGLQVFTEVCSSCHGLKYVYFRNLGDPGALGYTNEEIKAYAANFEVADTGDEAEPGDTRSAIPSDKFPPVTSAGAPDLSLMAKARKGFHGPNGLLINQILHGIGGPEYIASVLSGYTGETKEEAGATFYQNTAFPGGWIGMPPPLEDGQVEYADGHANDVHHMAADVAAFLMWTAEPKMMQRKQTGTVAVLLLVLLASLLYLTNKALWAPIKRKEH